MAELLVTGKVLSRFLEAAGLLRMLDQTRGTPTAHGLDPIEIGHNRKQCLQTKFLDSFALVCARQGAKNVTAACMEEGQPEGTVIRVASNGGVSTDILSKGQSVVSKLNRIASRELERKSGEAEILLDIIHINISRIRNYVIELCDQHNNMVRTRSDVVARIQKSLQDISLPRLEAFLMWMDQISAIKDFDTDPELESYSNYVRLAQEAKHNYLDLLDAVFTIGANFRPRWISVIFKLGRYGIASRAFVQLAVEFPALFNPMTVRPVSAARRVPSPKNELSFRLALRRLVGDKEGEFCNRLCRLWKEQDLEGHFRRQCPSYLVIHAEMQLVGFYDAQPHRSPAYSFIGVSKRSCYLCNQFLAIHPRPYSTSACHQKLYLSWIPPSTHDSKIYLRYKSLAMDLTRTMEAAAQQELEHRLGLPRRLVPADSSAGVSLSGLTGSSSLQAPSSPSTSSLSDSRQLALKQSVSAVEAFSSAEVPSKHTTQWTYKGPASSSHGSIFSVSGEPQCSFSDMVLHLERNGSVGQDIIRVADIVDSGSQKPSWLKLTKILEAHPIYDLGTRFNEDRDVLIVDDRIIVGSERQLIACLQYLWNADTMNAHVLVCDAKTLMLPTGPSILGQKDRSCDRQPKCP